MFCPSCGQEMNCPCESCRKHSKNPEEIVYKRNGDYTESCGDCGFTQSVDWWLDLDHDIMRYFRDKDKEEK